MNGKVKKVLSTAFVLASIINFNMFNNAYAETKVNQTIQYKFIQSYIIKHIQNSKGNAYNVSLKVDTGNDINSPYYYIDEKGNIITENNKNYFTNNPINVVNLNETNTVNFERVVSFKEIDYNIDKTKVTNNFSELANYQDYLKETIDYPTSNSLIRNKTFELINGKINIYDKVVEIFNYVQSNIKYTDTPEYANKGALNAFITNKGVCEEYAKLFTTMCRIAGIPARTVSGYAVREKSDLIDLDNSKHQWAEFYLPNHGWIIADASVNWGFDKNDISYFSKQTKEITYIPIAYDITEKDRQNFITLKYYALDNNLPQLTVEVDTKLYRQATTNTTTNIDTNITTNTNVNTTEQQKIDENQLVLDIYNLITGATTVKDIDNIQEKINMLSNVDKKLLQLKLDAKRNYVYIQTIQETINKINSGKGTIEDVKYAEDLLNKLPNSLTDKKILNLRLSGAKRKVK